MVVGLDRIRNDLQAVNARAEQLCTGLSGYELGWRSAPNRWSIAENLAHLRITIETFLPTIDRAINESKRRGMYSPGPFRLGLYGRILVWYVEPPPLIRLPAPKVLRPLGTRPATQALAKFMEAQDWMVKRIESADGLDLTALRFASPLAAYIRMNLLEYLCVGNGHSRRHLWQISNIRKAMNGTGQ